MWSQEQEANYKRVWFIALVVIVVIEVIGNLGAASNSPTDATQTAPTSGNAPTTTTQPTTQEPAKETKTYIAYDVSESPLTFMQTEP